MQSPGSITRVSVPSSATPLSSTACNEMYDGVSITSRLVVNGRRFGGCYNFTGMEEYNYPAYFTSRFEDGQVVRGDEGISVMPFNLDGNGTHRWALAAYDNSNGPQILAYPCINLANPSSATTPTSPLLEGQWVCDTDGNDKARIINDIHVDCGCPAGAAPEDYYTCHEYEDLAVTTSSGISYDGMPLDGCYKVDTRFESNERFMYFAESVKDGVPTLFVGKYLNTGDDSRDLSWSIGVSDKNKQQQRAVCYVDSRVGNSTSPGKGNWYCDVSGNSEGHYEPYFQGVDIQCGCMDDTFTTCYERDEGISIASSLVYNGQPVGGCYLPTNTSIDDEVVFAPNGEFEGHVGTLAVILSHVEGDYIWALTQLVEDDKELGRVGVNQLCQARVLDAEYPTSPLLRGHWMCKMGGSDLLGPADFDAIDCGCRDKARSSALPQPTPSTSTPSPLRMPTHTTYSTTPVVVTLAPSGEARTPAPSTVVMTRTPVRIALPPTTTVAEASVSQEASDNSPQGTLVGMAIGVIIGSVITLAGAAAFVFRAKLRGSRRNESDGNLSGTGLPSVEMKTLLQGENAGGSM